VGRTSRRRLRQAHPQQARPDTSRLGRGGRAEARARGRRSGDPGPAGTIPARFYEPLGHGDRDRPLIVYFHGGGWTIGDLDTATASAASSPPRRPRVLSVDYRLAPEHPFPARSRTPSPPSAGRVGGPPGWASNPDRIAVAGDSAGGNLAGAAALLAAGGDGPKPAMQALIYPIADTSREWRSRDTYAEGFLLTKADMEWFEGHYCRGRAIATTPASRC
jgi:acetyl esterase/lipase